MKVWYRRRQLIFVMNLHLHIIYLSLYATTTMLFSSSCSNAYPLLALTSSSRSLRCTTVQRLHRGTSHNRLRRPSSGYFAMRQQKHTHVHTHAHRWFLTGLERQRPPLPTVSTNYASVSFPLNYHRTATATTIPLRNSARFSSNNGDYDGDRKTSPFTSGSPFSFGDTTFQETVIQTDITSSDYITDSSSDSSSNAGTNGENPPLQELMAELESYRKRQSKELNKTPSSIINSATLDALYLALPNTKKELLNVKGIGPKKVEMFGDDILLIIKKYTQYSHGIYANNNVNNDDNDNNNNDNNNNDDDIEEDKEDMTKEKIRKTQLKEDLKLYRSRQSTPLNKPAYTIFTNAALDGIYAALPTTKEELIAVKGIGSKKIEMFGDDILSIVSKYSTCPRDDTYDSSLTVRPGTTTTLPIPRPTTIDPSTLTPEQLHAASLPLHPSRPNVFITGSAGTGKSYLLRYIVQTLRAQHPSRKVGICAPTGVAAVIVHGSTLHSYFGVGLGTGSVSSLAAKVAKNKAAVERIDGTEVLIVDECSMLSAELLETLDGVVRAVRNGGRDRGRVFGGIQIVAFGDFFQLPPVYRGDGGGDRGWRPFCFDSPVWGELGLSDNVVELERVQRQEDGDFVSLLNRVRVGDIEEQDIQDLNARCLLGESKPLPTDGIVPTRLYVLNRDVDSENESRLEDLKGEEIVCEAWDAWREAMPLDTLAAVKKKMRDGLGMEMPDEVRLKVGAQVMLTRNRDLEKNLVNGSRGVIVSFVPAAEGGGVVPIVRFDSGIVTKVAPVESVQYNPDGGKGCLVRMQIPLKLAWAITIHKSQGSTLTRALLDMTSAFEYGQCYVALSRVKSLDGLWLERPARLQNIKVSPQVLDFFQKKRINTR